MYTESIRSGQSDKMGGDTNLAPDARGSHMSLDKSQQSQMMPPGLDLSGGSQDNLKPGDQQPGNYPE